MRKYGRKDGNHDDIVDALEKAGGGVLLGVPVHVIPWMTGALIVPQLERSR